MPASFLFKIVILNTVVLRIIGDMVDVGGEGHSQGKSASQLCANVSEKLFDHWSR